VADGMIEVQFNPGIGVGGRIGGLSGMGILFSTTLFFREKLFVVSGRLYDFLKKAISFAVAVCFPGGGGDFRFGFFRDFMYIGFCFHIQQFTYTWK
jgi:hypothetical protein